MCSDPLEHKSESFQRNDIDHYRRYHHIGVSCIAKSAESAQSHLTQNEGFHLSWIIDPPSGHLSCGICG